MKIFKRKKGIKILNAIFIILLIILIVSILITKDFFSPVALICESYLLAIVCAMYNAKTWGISLHYNTAYVIIIGILSFIFPAIYFYLEYIKKRKSNIKKLDNEIKYIDCTKKIMCILTFISIIIAGLYLYYFIKAIGGLSGISELSSKMEVYRENTQFKDINYIPTFVNVLSKFCRALAYINVYILINNLLCKKDNKKKYNKKKLWIYIPGIIIFIPLTLSTGGRFDLISLCITVIIMFIILYRKAYNKNIEMGKVMRILSIVVLILILFSISRVFVGRTSQSSTIYYITSYFGGSIECFDMFMQDSNTLENVPVGNELFACVRKFMNQINLIENDEFVNTSMQFRISSTGILVGNIYTGFRKMYHDFGLSGVIFFQALLSIIFNKMYYRILLNNKLRLISMPILVYSTIIISLVLHSFSEIFYSTILSFNYIVLFIMMYCIRYVIIKGKK